MAWSLSILVGGVVLPLLLAQPLHERRQPLPALPPAVPLLEAAPEYALELIANPFLALWEAFLLHGRSLPIWFEDGHLP